MDGGGSITFAGQNGQYFNFAHTNCIIPVVLLEQVESERTPCIIDAWT